MLCTSCPSGNNNFRLLKSDLHYNWQRNRPAKLFTEIIITWRTRATRMIARTSENMSNTMHDVNALLPPCRRLRALAPSRGAGSGILWVWSQRRPGPRNTHGTRTEHAR